MANPTSKAQPKRIYPSDALKRQCQELLASETASLSTIVEALCQYSDAFHADIPLLTGNCPSPECLSCLLITEEETFLMRVQVKCFMDELYSRCEDFKLVGSPADAPEDIERCGQWLQALESVPLNERYKYLTRP